MRKSSLVLFVVFALTGCSQYTVPTPEHWSDSLVVKETHFTENRTVGDRESATTLFTSHMYPTAQPVDVQKIDAHHWLAVFEQPDPLLKSRVRVERISDVEFRVVLEPAAAMDKER